MNSDTTLVADSKEVSMLKNDVEKAENEFQQTSVCWARVGYEMDILMAEIAVNKG